MGDELGLSGGSKFFSPRNRSEFGEPGDVFYDNESHKYFILRKEGIPQNHDWSYPLDGMDNDEWIYAGIHPGSLIQPKGWSEYGKAGSVYYGRKEGYAVLKKDGRPSDHNWYYPSDGVPNDNFYPLKLDIGDFRMPFSPEKAGVKGSVYLFVKDYFILKKAIQKKPDGNTYPYNKKDNEFWIYAGIHEGTIQDPKKWNEYGKRGCIYFYEGVGYFRLKNDGRPSDNNWYFPEIDESDEKWEFVSREIGTVTEPKLFTTEGLAGEVYYDIASSSFFILRRDGKPSTNNWSYPVSGKNNNHWLYLDEKNSRRYFYNDLV